DAAESVIDAIVNVIAPLSVAHCFTNDRGYRGCRCGHQKTAWLREDLDVLGKQTRHFAINFFGQRAEWLHMLVVRRGKTASDIQNLYLMTARSRLRHHSSGHIQGLHKILEVRALAPHMET